MPYLGNCVSVTEDRPDEEQCAHDQCDAKPTSTFLAAWHCHCYVAGLEAGRVGLSDSHIPRRHRRNRSPISVLTNQARRTRSNFANETDVASKSALNMWKS